MKQIIIGSYINTKREDTLSPLSVHLNRTIIYLILKIFLKNFFMPLSACFFCT